MGSALTMREVEAVELETEVINSAELAKRLRVPESWVRSRRNPKRTSDPIPHYKLGRYINFPWGSSVLRNGLIASSWARTETGQEGDLNDQICSLSKRATVSRT